MRTWLSFYISLNRILVTSGVLLLVVLGQLMYGKTCFAGETVEATKDALERLTDPTDDSNEKAVSTEILVSLSEEKAIKQLQRIIATRKGSPIEPDLHLRLAELYMRRSKTTRFFELSGGVDGTGKSTKPKIIKDKTTGGYLKKAISTYDSIRHRFPKYRNMDLVLFNSAFALQQIGQEAKAEQHYLLVIRQYPHSPLVADSHLAIGEMAFGKQRYAVSLEHFLAVKNYRHSRVYPYGMYKAAWAYYNLHNSTAAIRELEAVVEFGREVEREGLDARLDLRREALADMPMLFEDVYTPNQAFDYFRKWAGDNDLSSALLRMARIYERHGKRKSQRIVLRSIIADLSEDGLRPQAHNDLTWSFEEDFQREDAIKELIAFDELCQSDSRWSRVNRVRYESLQKRDDSSKSDKVNGSQVPVDESAQSLTVPECRELVDGTSLKLAMKWQRLWNKNEKVGLFGDVSKKAYLIYLNGKPQDDSINEYRYQFAELLFKRKEYRAASVQYAIVARTSQESGIRHDSGYASLVSLEKAVADVWSDEDERLFQELAKVYVERNPKGKYVVDIEFKTAFIAYNKKRYLEAEPRLKRLGHKYPDSPRGVKAQDLYLDILNINKNFRELKSAAKQLSKLTKDKARQASLAKIYQESYFSEIQEIEEKGRLEAAIGEYQKFARENPTSPLASGAMWNAAQLLEKSGKHYLYANTLLAFYEKYPKDKRAKDALLLAGQRFEDLGELEKATTCLEKLAIVDPTNAVKWQRLAVEFYYVTGQVKQGRSLVAALQSHLKGKEEEEFLAQIAGYEAQFGNEGSYQSFVAGLSKKGIEPYRTMEREKELRRLYKSGRNSQAFSLAKEIIGHRNSSQMAKAEARLIQAKILDSEFQGQSVKASVERIALVLSIKTEKLAKAQEAYQAAMRYGNAQVNIEALEGLSGCFKHYSQSLRSITLPSSVPKADADAFRSEIDALVIPMEEKAVETLVQALQQAKKAKIYDGTVGRLQQEVNEINLKSDPMVEIEVDSVDVALPKILNGGSV